MNQTNARASDTHNGLIALVVVIVAGYVAYFSSGTATFFPLYKLLITVGLGMVYLTLSVWASLKEDKGSCTRTIYMVIAVQLLLGGVINFLSLGSTWLILLPIVSTAFQHLPRRWAVLISTLVWLIQIIPLLMSFGWEQMFQWGFAFLAAVVFVAVFTLLMVSEQKARLELAETHRKLQEYTLKVEELAILQERNRLAREIHDGLGHYLTAINIQIKAALAQAGQNSSMVEAALKDARQLSEDALADVRRSVSALRADPSTNRPLPETLQGLCEDTRKTGLQVNFCTRGQVRPLSGQIEMALYRTAQEGLTNARKHAHASHVDIELDYAKHQVTLNIIDNGEGCDDPAGGFGLTGLHERLELLGGELSVSSTLHEGFRLSARLPIDRGNTDER